MKRAPGLKNKRTTPKPAPLSQAAKKPATPPIPKEMMEVEKESYIRLVRRVRDLEAINDKLNAHMKVISEASS